MYCSIEDIRAEGVTEDQAGDARLTELIGLSCAYIDRMTRQWFEPREKTLRLDGTGGEVLPLPVFLIEQPESVTVDGEPVTDFTLYNRFPPADDRGYPKMRRKALWPKGILNVEIKGLWGYVDEGPDGGYVTPPLIRRAAMKLALYNFPSLGDSEAQEEKALRGALLKETTDGHSYELAADVLTAMASNSITGDAEIDQILMQFASVQIRMALA